MTKLTKLNTAILIDSYLKYTDFTLISDKLYEDITSDKFPENISADDDSVAINVRVCIFIQDLYINNKSYGDVTIVFLDDFTKKEIKNMKSMWKIPGFLKRYIIGYTSSKESTLDAYENIPGYVLPSIE